jgi:hypothetical protein
MSYSHFSRIFPETPSSYWVPRWWKLNLGNRKRTVWTDTYKILDTYNNIHIYMRIHTQYIMCCRIKYWIHIQCQSDFWMVQHQWSAISPCWPSSPANPRLEYWIWTGLALTRGQFGAMLLFLRYTNTYLHIVISIYIYVYFYIYRYMCIELYMYVYLNIVIYRYI